MTATKRLTKVSNVSGVKVIMPNPPLTILQELADLRQAGSKCIRNIVVKESNILQWNLMLVPVSNLG